MFEVWTGAADHIEKSALQAPACSLDNIFYPSFTNHLYHTKCLGLQTMLRKDYQKALNEVQNSVVKLINDNETLINDAVYTEYYLGLRL